jgi:hypothetical protein
VLGILEIGSCKLFAQGWLQARILLGSAFRVARIIGATLITGEVLFFQIHLRKK